tara:strand:+ start:334 stop:507 length:174 start_codon:yes stop_codon:yes gene_type:complete
MQDEASEEINLKPKPKAERIAKDNAARKRRSDAKGIIETRMINEHNRLRRERRKRQG